MNEPGAERIQKLIASAGLCSRREAERHIADGAVRVDGKVAQLGDKALPDARIFVHNRPLPAAPEKPVTLALHKPKGFVCTNADPNAEKTVFDLLPPEFRRMRLFCAGRLDKDSEGLLIITNDGELAHRLTHPGARIEKRYRLVLHRDFNREDIPKLLQGTEVEGDFLKAEKIIPAPENGPDHKRRLEVRLHHGKKREVRRLFEAHGYYVKKLVRRQIGGLVLKNIPRGGTRVLKRAEIESLFA